MENLICCKRCVMDNSSDSTIIFDENGFCNYCTSALKRMEYTYFPNYEGKRKLEKLISILKLEGNGKKYDCLMGISGGLDSSYLAYLGSTKWGLRILAVHIDDGFDTEISKKNIKKLVESTGIDLIIEKPDPIQFNDLTKAYILAEVPNLAIPQDNILFACLYNYARKYKIKNFLSGTNFALESILQQGNTYRAFDVKNIKAIHKRFGTEQINKLQFLSDYKRFFDRYVLNIKTYCPLNFIDYRKEEAIKELSNFCGFEYYDGKHLENTLTKFIQLYWFYNKFGVDKRKSHLSSMIISNQITREEALLELQKPLYDKDIMESEINLICKSLKIDRKELDEILKKPGKQHTEYPIDKFYLFFKKKFS